MLAPAPHFSLSDPLHTNHIFAPNKVFRKHRTKRTHKEPVVSTRFGIVHDRLLICQAQHPGRTGKLLLIVFNYS
jgi:hypothetical protein